MGVRLQLLLGAALCVVRSPLCSAPSRLSFSAIKTPPLAAHGIEGFDADRGESPRSVPDELMPGLLVATCAAVAGMAACRPRSSSQKRSFSKRRRLQPETSPWCPSGLSSPTTTGPRVTFECNEDTTSEDSEEGVDYDADLCDECDLQIPESPVAGSGKLKALTKKLWSK